METNYGRCLRLQAAVIFWFALCPIQLAAQQTSSIHALSIKPTAGIDMANAGGNDRNFLFGLHVSYDRDLSASSQPWVALLNAKGLSFGILWHNMHHMKEIVDGQTYTHGTAMGMLSEVDFQLLQAGSAKLLFTPGIGLTYITETIDTQPATTTVGSHLNLTLTAELGLEIPVSDRTSLSAAANILHYSNGGLKIPNGGINTVNGTIGIKTALGHVQQTASAGRSDFRPIVGGSGELVVGAGRRGKYRTDGGFWRTGIYGGYNYYLNQAFGFKAGVDLVYYHQVFDGNFETTFQYYGSSYDRVRLGASAGAEVGLGRFAINGMFGKYLHYRSFHNIQWYWTSALRYYLTPNIALQSTLYMHRVQADYLNWAVVFRI
ncbi:acyloxyacyl hydrolase [Parapedobacter indicus]|uniref:Lipid A 3-O-deacylase (PagL) n=1 Tax=Parapedobacter indicus TaxID=1477437 RepID=A0A1I3T7E9_9SPHI|nr:acyloxyacyl hydrolase [Parapedobacter indicus]PPK99614.1 lipid A 3-O-deacylase PagL [Parapedobacter indicus]SFJ66493.1 Lipid A 3-O-deacylase (PagL) [Parapedobacter indicus]